MSDTTKSETKAKGLDEITAVADRIGRKYMSTSAVVALFVDQGGFTHCAVQVAGDEVAYTRAPTPERALQLAEIMAVDT